MSFFEKARNIFAAEERKIKSPIFVKDFEETNNQLADLNQLSEKVISGPKKENILKDIAFLRQGMSGEKNVYFELKNSFLPTLCLHDIRLEYDGYVAQFDFIVLSPSFICVLETKKLSGNITINSDGDFIRIIKDKTGREVRREGIYSPISQNDRHIRILKEVLLKEGLAKTMPYRSLVVMADPKTIINKDKCPAPIKKSLYRHDQVVNYLEKLQNELKEEKYVMEQSLWNIANFLKDNHVPITPDYMGKYGLTEADFIKGEPERIQPKQQPTTQPNTQLNTQPNTLSNGSVAKHKDPEILTKELKEFRLTTSRTENVKPYFIFDNKQMEDLIAKLPRTKEELLTIYGFGPKKVEKYGDEILRIINS
jgi:hypothetical protein